MSFAPRSASSNTRHIPGYRTHPPASARPDVYCFRSPVITSTTGPTTPPESFACTRSGTRLAAIAPQTRGDSKLLLDPWRTLAAADLANQNAPRHEAIWTRAGRPQASRIPWAELLLRVFREDVLLCPCGGRRVVLAFITEKKVVREILERLGLPTTGPPIAPARIASEGEDAPWQDDVPELQQPLR